MSPNALPRRLLACFACVSLTLSAAAQSLTLDDEVARHAALTSTNVTMTGSSELHIDDGGDPVRDSTIRLNSEDAWVFFHAVTPSATASNLLPRIRVEGAPAALGTNVRVVQHASGSVVIPHPPDLRPLEVFTGRALTGRSRQLAQYTDYDATSLGAFAGDIRSFTLKRGYMATFAENEDGTGNSRVYVAQDGDLEASLMPGGLDRAVRFVRVFPWRWTGKKGSCDVDPASLNADWHYNWDINKSSTLDWEYAGIRQQRWWPGLDQDWEAREIHHLSGFNEPDNPVEDAYTSLNNGSVDAAIAAWPDLLASGLRVGAPAVTDGGTGWLYEFMDKADAAGLRVDYVPIHYYRSHPNPDDPQGAANQLYDFLRSVHDRVQRPIWVTEFNNGANWTDNNHDPNVNQNRAAIEAMIEMMDDTPWIERYAVYSDVEWFRRTHYDGGSLTPMGAMYRDHEAPIAYRQTVPDSGRPPAADYLFDGHIRDTSGHGHNPVIHGTPRFVPGKRGEALSFDGSDDFLALPPALGDSTDFSFTAWVKWEGGDNWQRIFDLGNGTSEHLFLCAKTPSNTLRFAIKDGGGEQRLNAPLLPIGEWAHVAVTLEGDTGRLYVDGALIDTATITINPADVASSTNYLGKSQFPDPLFRGALDDARFLTRALDQAEIATAASDRTLAFNADPVTLGDAAPGQSYAASVAESVEAAGGDPTFSKLGGPGWLTITPDGRLTGVPAATDTGETRCLIRVSDGSGRTAVATATFRVTEPPGLVARYPFDGSAAAAVGILDGAIAGSPRYASGRFGDSILLDGSSNHVTLPAGVAHQDEITLAAWVRWDGGDRWQRIFDFGNGTGEFLFLTPRSGNDTLRFVIKRGDEEQQLEATQLPIGTWTHVAVTLGNATGRLYVDGSLVDSSVIELKPSDILPASNFLGGSQYPDPLFDGRLDEFLIFNRALEAAEIADIHAADPPAFELDDPALPPAPVDEDYDQSIGTSAGDPVFSKAAGPRWLHVEPDGRIHGVPGHADAGANNFRIRATDGNGLAAETTLTITVPAPGDLHAHYEFTDDARDSAGRNHGSVSGAPGYIDAAHGRALTFDGENDAVTLPSGTFARLRDVTIAARFRWDGGPAWQRIFDFGNGTDEALFLTPRSSAGTMRFGITNGGAQQQLEAPSPTPGEWTHAAVTLDGNTGALYLNGALVDTAPISIDPADFMPAVNYLGDSQWTGDPFLDGAIDDFRIYDRPLTAAEISALAVPPAPVPVTPTSPYASWTGGYDFPPAQDLPVHDPDADGLANVFEFLFGSDPTDPGSRAMPEASARTAAELGMSGSDRYFTLTARVRADRGDLDITAEAGATPAALGEPDATTRAVPTGPAVPDGDFEIHTWRYHLPMRETGTAFMRLRTTGE